MTVFFRTCYRKVTYSFGELYLFHENAVVLFHANAVSACVSASRSRFKRNVYVLRHNITSISISPFVYKLIYNQRFSSLVNNKYYSHLSLMV